MPCWCHSNYHTVIGTRQLQCVLCWVMISVLLGIVYDLVQLFMDLLIQGAGHCLHLCWAALWAEKSFPELHSKLVFKNPSDLRRVAQAPMRKEIIFGSHSCNPRHLSLSTIDTLCQIILWWRVRLEAVLFIIWCLPACLVSMYDASIIATPPPQSSCEDQKCL